MCLEFNSLSIQREPDHDVSERNRWGRTLFLSFGIQHSRRGRLIERSMTGIDRHPLTRARHARSDARSSDRLILPSDTSFGGCDTVVTNHIRYAYS